MGTHNGTQSMLFYFLYVGWRYSGRLVKNCAYMGKAAFLRCYLTLYNVMLLFYWYTYWYTQGLQAIYGFQHYIQADMCINLRNIIRFVSDNGFYYSIINACFCHQCNESMPCLVNIVIWQEISEMPLECCS